MPESDEQAEVEEGELEEGELEEGELDNQPNCSYSEVPVIYYEPSQLVHVGDGEIRQEVK